MYNIKDIFYNIIGYLKLKAMHDKGTGYYSVVSTINQQNMSDHLLYSSRDFCYIY